MQIQSIKADEQSMHTAEAGYLDKLSPLLFGAEATERLLLVFAAYFDESGTHSDSKVLSVAGYIAEIDQWTHFEREWRLLLTEAGFKPGEPFHMTDYESRIGRYSTWSNEFRLEFLRRAIGIVKRRVQHGFSSSVDMRSYQELISDPVETAGLNSQDGAHSPYSFCVSDCLKQVAHWADLGNHSETIAYFFESGAGFGNDVNRLMEEVGKDGELKARFRYRSWGFGSKIDILQFQAADLNAYESYKHWCNELHAAKQRPMRRSFESLLDIPQIGQYIARDDLLRVINSLVPSLNQ